MASSSYSGPVGAGTKRRRELGPVSGVFYAATAGQRNDLPACLFESWTGCRHCSCTSMNGWLGLYRGRTTYCVLLIIGAAGVL